MREYVTYRNDPLEQLTQLSLASASSANTASGILFADVSLIDADYVVDLYKRAGRAPADLVATGSTSSSPGTVTLEEANGSGLSGTARVNYAADAAGDGGPTCVVFYCDGDDLLEWEAGLIDLLDANGNYAGEQGLDAVVREAKRLIDRYIEGRIAGSPILSTGTPVSAASIANPSALRVPAIHTGLAWMYRRERFSANDGRAQLAARYELERDRAWQAIQLVRSGSSITVTAAGALRVGRA